MPAKRTFAGFAAARSGAGFVIHIIDDADEVFEIEASRENIERIIRNLEEVLAGRSGEDAHAKG